MGTISKALVMLNHFSRARPEIGLGEFVRLSGREKATVHRHLAELEAMGFLEKDTARRVYRLGPALLRLAGVREATQPMRSLLSPIVRRLAEDAGELAHASLLQGDALSPVTHHDPQRHATQIRFDQAELLPLHATSSGLALLAFAEAKQVDSILSRPLTTFTDRTVADPAALRRLIASSRDTGFGQIDESFDPEVRSQGVAIFDAAAKPIGAISVSIPSIRASTETIAGLRPLLAQAMRDATRSIGGAPPDDHPLNKTPPDAGAGQQTGDP